MIFCICRWAHWKIAAYGFLAPANTNSNKGIGKWTMLWIINPCKAITRLINQNDRIHCLIKRDRLMTHKYSVHWNTAYVFIQTNTATYNSNNGNSLLYKSGPIYTLHVVRWLMNFKKPMRRLVNPNNWILCRTYCTSVGRDCVLMNKLYTVRYFICA